MFTSMTLFILLVSYFQDNNNNNNKLIIEQIFSKDINLRNSPTTSRALFLSNQLPVVVAVVVVIGNFFFFNILSRLNIYLSIKYSTHRQQTDTPIHAREKKNVITPFKKFCILISLLFYFILKITLLLTSLFFFLYL